MEHRRPPSADVVRLIRSQVVHVGQAVWNTLLYLGLDQAVDMFSAHGARVVLFTMPDINAADEAPGSAACPENSQSQVDGVQVRWPDGVNISRARVPWL
jgi:hypothetical protein